MQRLSAFGEPEDGHVHIIIVCDPPTGESEHSDQSVESDHFHIDIDCPFQFSYPFKLHHLK